MTDHLPSKDLFAWLRKKARYEQEEIRPELRENRYSEALIALTSQQAEILRLRHDIDRSVANHAADVSAHEPPTRLSSGPVDNSPCPFCGASADDSTLTSISTEKIANGYVVECDKCYARGPIKPTEDAACASWNRATYDPSPRKAP